METDQQLILSPDNIPVLSKQNAATFHQMAKQRIFETGNGLFEYIETIRFFSALDKQISGDSATKIEPDKEMIDYIREQKTGRVANLPGAKKAIEKPAKDSVSLHIVKVKLVKNEHLSIAFNRIEPDATTSDDSYENKMRPVHEDCKKAFKALAIHMGLLCDYISTQQVKDISKYNPDLIEKFNVTGISIGGNDDDEGIVLTGHKLTKSGKAIILNSPFTRYEENAETAYRFIDDLQDKVAVVINEAKQYMTGKRGEDPQT